MQALFEPEWKDDAYYKEQWRQFYVDRSNALKKLSIGILPFLLLIGIGAIMPSNWLQNRFIAYAFIIIGLAAWLFYAFRLFTSGVAVQGFTCPRCGESFFVGGVWRNSFTRRCLHCGLRRMKRREV